MIDFIISVVALVLGSLFYLTMGALLISLIFSGYLIYVLFLYFSFVFLYMIVEKFFKKKTIAFLGTFLLYIIFFFIYGYYTFHTPPTTSSLFENAKFACRFAQKFHIKYPYDLDPCVYRTLAHNYRRSLQSKYNKHLTEEDKKMIWEAILQDYKTLK